MEEWHLSQRVNRYSIVSSVELGFLDGNDAALSPRPRPVHFAEGSCTDGFVTEQLILFVQHGRDGAAAVEALVADEVVSLHLSRRLHGTDRTRTGQITGRCSSCAGRFWPIAGAGEIAWRAVPNLLEARPVLITDPLPASRFLFFYTPSM